MELSQTTLRGLQVAGSSSVDDRSFTRLVQLAIQYATQDIDQSILQDDPKLSKLSPAVAKESFSSLMTFILEGARSDTDQTGMSAVLEECKYTPDRINSLQTLYTENKSLLRANLERVKYSLPYLVDINWKLDYYIKSNYLEKVDKPVYLIKLKTEVGGDQMGGANGHKDILFSCTQEQLQDLVSKLKDASRALERYSQQ